jgi:hypothetical protein
MHDVDLHNRGSLIDRAVEELFESREHKALRRTVNTFAQDREQRLKNEIGAAREIAASSSREAVEFKQSSFFGLKKEPVYSPVFTSAEIEAIEMRASRAKNPQEAARLRKILESAADQPARSLKEILRDFENPQTTYTQPKERDRAVRTAPEGAAGNALEGHADGPIRADKEQKPYVHFR